MVDHDHDPGAGNIVVGQGIARTAELLQGDLMTFRDSHGVPMSLQVAGILSSDSELVSADLMLMSEADFRSLFGIQPGYATDFVLRVKNPVVFLPFASASHPV